MKVLEKKKEIYESQRRKFLKRLFKNLQQTSDLGEQGLLLIASRYMKDLGESNFQESIKKEKQV